MDELLTLDDAERLAEKVVPADAWSYISGGIGSSVWSTVRASSRTR